MSGKGRRIALIHALQDSQVPIWQAFKEGWPEADIFNVMDDSLPGDLAATGTLDQAITDRFLTLGRYAANLSPVGRRTEAILFSCSAFGQALEAVKRDVDIPVLRPNEAAFEEALAIGGRIGLMVTFGPALPPLEAELRSMAAERGLSPEITGIVAEGGLAALQSGRPEEQDRIAADVASRLPPVDVLVLGQFSLARSAPAVRGRGIEQVITTPGSAVAKLRRLLDR